MGAWLLAGALVVYNNLANRWEPFARVAYVPMNVAATACVLLVAFAGFGLSSTELGLAWSRAWIGLIPGAVTALVLGAALTSEGASKRLVDHRLDGISGAGALYMVLVRIPIGTALLEEIAFRGVLFAAFRGEGTASAIVLSSVAFGLWHVAPTVNLVRANGRDARLVQYVTGGVILTGIAGAGLCMLRVWAHSLVAPLLAHALTNSFAASASFRARDIQLRGGRQSPQK